MEGREALVKPAAGRLSCTHQCIHVGFDRGQWTDDFWLKTIAAPAHMRAAMRIAARE
jgi:hypothetical protein